MNKFAIFALALFAIIASAMADKKSPNRRLQTAAPVAVVPVAVVAPVAVPTASKGGSKGGASSAKGTKRKLADYFTPYEK